MDVYSGCERFPSMASHSPLAKGPLGWQSGEWEYQGAPLSPCEGKDGESGTARLQPPAGSPEKPGGGPEFPGSLAGIAHAVGDHCTYPICQYIH